jgi:hypothetical protein
LCNDNMLYICIFSNKFNLNQATSVFSYYLILSHPKRQEKKVLGDSETPGQLHGLVDPCLFPELRRR